MHLLLLLLHIKTKMFNPLIQAMIIPAALGTAMYSVNVIGSYIFRAYISHNLYSYVNIHSTESEYFEAVLDFIQDHKLLKANHFVAYRRRPTLASSDIRNDTQLLESIHYRPADSGGAASMLYKGRIVYVTRMAGETLTVGRDQSILKLETLSLCVLGTDPTILKTLISDAIDRVNRTRVGFLRILVPCDYAQEWKLALNKKPRPPDSVVLDKTISCDIIEDARKFLDSSAWYSNVGIPHRRGYLFHGPPGCGKTSFCQVLAGALELDIYMLSLSGRYMTDVSLSRLLSNVPCRALVLLEDVDVVFASRSKKNLDDGVYDDTFPSNVTFSGLLNAIDGVASEDGRIFVMTTNHIEKLDPALIRPGRCDVKVMFCNASYEQIITMFLRFFPGSSSGCCCHCCGNDNNNNKKDSAARRFADALPVGKLSLAQIQCHLVKHRHSAIDAIETAASCV